MTIFSVLISEMKSMRLCVFLFLFIFVLTGCEQNVDNFSQYPGFAEYFEANPPSHELPGLREQSLIYHFRPRFMLGAGQPKPIDFYRDYIAHGFLRDGSGKVVSRNVTQGLLNAYKDDPDAVFMHVPGGDVYPAVVFGRINRENVTFDTSEGQITHLLTFLSYHIVFRTSGLPVGIPSWQEAVLSLSGNLDDWHQLDNYTTVILVMEGDGYGRRKPFAVILQQHDNLRTYLVDKDIILPYDDRVVIDVAIRSNELYPHITGRTRHRAITMPDPKGMRFLLTGEKKPLFAGYDITDSTIETEYSLSFLPPDDAFYTFKGFLGERRHLPGRDGPQGADYNTLPELKSMAMQLFSGYWRENHQGDLERLEATVVKKGDYVGFARLQGAELFKSWKRIQKHNGH